MHDDLCVDDFSKDPSNNRVLQNIPNVRGSKKRPVPIPPNTMRSTPVRTSSTGFVSPTTSATRNLRRSFNNANAQYNNLNNIYSMASNAYGDAYGNSYSYLNGAPTTNYNPYNSFGQVGQPLVNHQFQNPVIIAAAENSRPAFETIQTVVQTFNAISTMLDSTLAAMHMSFQALLGVADNFTRLRTFMMQLSSSLVSFKLAKWFITKLLSLIRMVYGGKVASDEELWRTISSANQITPSDGPSWPFMVFTGLLTATPYFVYKLLNSVTPITPEAVNPTPQISANRTASAPRINKKYPFVFKAVVDWFDSDPITIPLMKERPYYSTLKRISYSEQNGGWIYVEDSSGNEGYVPYNMLECLGQCRGRDRTQPELQVPNITNMTSNVEPQCNSEEIQLQSTSQILDVHDNPIDLPHPLVDSDKLKNDS